MATSSMKKSLEDLLRMPADRLKDKLSPTLEEIRNYDLGKLLGECPDLLTRLLDRLKQVDAARLFSEVPGVADQLTDLLWEGVCSQAGQSKDMNSVLEKAERDFHVNIEASDSPFRSHFVVEKGKIRGRSGLLHFKDEDFRFMGPTDVLIELLTGELFLGVSNLRLQTAGHSGWISRILPVMQEISKLLRGSLSGGVRTQKKDL
jgi:hypothetical protein